MGIDAVVTLRLDPHRSGTARFNEILADRLAVPLLGLENAWEERKRPLLSFKPAELDEGGAQAFIARLEEAPPLEVFLHEWAGVAAEHALVGRAEVVWCGNREIRRAVEGLAPDARDAWAPGLLVDARPYEPAEISVFSFGMAHKVRTDMFARLKALLESSGRSYAVYMSHANHETATLADADAVYDELRGVFARGLYFLGSLSDVAVYNHLITTTFFATFFPEGARANNTSVASAMEHGAVVITNLDELSPPELHHMENVIDIGRCDELPHDPLVLKRLSANAMETARGLGWDRLVETIHGGGG